MRIFQGFRSLDEIGSLLDAGADELYTGFHDPAHFPLKNHYEPEFGLLGVDALERALDFAHARDARIFLAVNQGSLSDHEIDQHADNLATLDAKGVDGFIVASLPLLVRLARYRLRGSICLSTLQPCFNVRALAFFRSLGVSRVVLPEQATGQEARGMLVSGIELEAMFWPTHDCCNIEAWCIFHHQHDRYLRIRPECHFAYCSAQPRIEGLQGCSERSLETVSAEIPREGRFLMNGFGNLWDHHLAGVQWLKMGNRPHQLEHKVALLQAARELCDLLDKAMLDRLSFVAQAQGILQKRLAQVGLPSLGQAFAGTPGPLHRERRRSS